MDDATSKACSADAHRWLKKNHPEAVDRLTGIALLFIRRTAVEPKSRKQKIAIVTLAYALMLVHGERQSLLNAILSGRPRKGALREPARIFIEELVLCEPGLPASKLYSRWTKAVVHLRDRGVLPSEIASLSQQRGEGIDQWARGGSAQGTKQVKTAGKLTEPAIVRVTIGSAGHAAWRWREGYVSSVRATDMRLAMLWTDYAALTLIPAWCLMVLLARAGGAA